MMLLGDDEYKHVERRCWSRQSVSRREERGAYYTIFKELAMEDSAQVVDLVDLVDSAQVASDCSGC